MNRACAALIVLAAIASTVAAQQRENTPSASVVEYHTFHSEALQRDVPYGVYLPAGYQDDLTTYPVLIFLHGLNNNEKEWERRGLPEIVDDLIANKIIQKMIIAVPEGENSFYTNAVDGSSNYEDAIVKEFVPFLDHTYRTKNSARYRGISGVSMGGYGALKIGMRYPQLFNSVSAHSPFLLAKPLEEFTEDEISQWMRRSFQRIFGNPINQAYWRENDPISIVQTQNGDFRSLPYYFDCGTDDRFGFYAGARRLAQAMDARGIHYTFHLFPGGRSHWDEVVNHAQGSLKFHSEHFYAKRTVSQY